MPSFLLVDLACLKELLIVEGTGHAQSQDKESKLYYGSIKKFLAEVRPCSVIIFGSRW